MTEDNKKPSLGPFPVILTGGLQAGEFRRGEEILRPHNTPNVHVIL
jgi:hypothetical protein